MEDVMKDLSKLLRTMRFTFLKVNTLLDIVIEQEKDDL